MIKYALFAALLLTTACTNRGDMIASRCERMGFIPGTKDNAFCQLELQKTLGWGGLPIPGTGTANIRVLEGD